MDSAPELPSFEGFVRFQDNSQLFLTVRRVGYRTIQIQSPGAESWIDVQFDQLAPEERTRVLRKTAIDEETNLPELNGIRVTLESGEVLEGFTEGPSPVRSSNGQNEPNSTSKNGESNSDTKSVKKFVVLTANEGRRELSSSLVKDMEKISVNPIKMVGAQELYEIERRKRSADDPRTHWKLGKLCMKTELYKKAAGHFKQAGKMNSSFKQPAQLRLDILRNWVKKEGASGGSNKTGSQQGSGSTGGGFGQ